MLLKIMVVIKIKIKKYQDSSLIDHNIITTIDAYYSLSYFERCTAIVPECGCGSGTTIRIPEKNNFGPEIGD